MIMANQNVFAGDSYIHVKDDLFQNKNGGFFLQVALPELWCGHINKGGEFFQFIC